MLIHKSSIHYIMIGVWCVMTGTRIAGPMFFFFLLWDHKFSMLSYNSDVSCAMIVWFLIKCLQNLERISGDRIISRGLLPLHSKALKPCNWFLFVLHVKGQEYSEINFVLNIFTDCELILWLYKSQSGGTNTMQGFEKSPKSNLLLNKTIVLCMSEIVSKEITILSTFCSTVMNTTWPPFLESVNV